MRDIIFRAIEYGSTDFVYGDLRRDRIDVCICDIEGNVGHIVLPETVGQYTGLKDKTGEMIFEGDILSYVANSFINHICGEPFKSYISPIRWNEEELCFWVGLVGTVGFKPDKNTDDGKFEIIGNIHKNKDLLS